MRLFIFLLCTLLCGSIKSQPDYEHFKQKKEKDLQTFKTTDEKQFEAFQKIESEWMHIVLDGTDHQDNKGKNKESFPEEKIKEENKVDDSKNTEPVKGKEHDESSMTGDDEHKEAIVFKLPIRLKSVRISSPFGDRIHPVFNRKNFHSGIDYVCPEGTEIHAVAAGKIEKTGYQEKGYGKYIIIKHEKGFKSIYAHLDRIKAKTGDRVSQGFVIGLVGKTGMTTGAHLHFELIKDNKHVDPEIFFDD